jgi:hypothetical protein
MEYYNAENDSAAFYAGALRARHSSDTFFETRVIKLYRIVMFLRRRIHVLPAMSFTSV